MLEKTDMVGIEGTRLACHGSECQMREHFLLFLSQGVNPAGHPDSDKGINELLTGQSVLLQEQFEYALALLFNQFVSFAHNAVVSDDLRGQR